MTTSKNRLKRRFGGFTIVLILLFMINHLIAQQVIGLSVGYETFPFAELTDPIPDAPGLEIQASALSLGAAFPMVFSNGKIMVLNQLNYKRIDFAYHNMPEGATDPEQIQSVDYTLFMIDSLSQKWKMVIVLTPGLASDFEDKVSGDDFTFGGVFGFIRQMSHNFQLGFGFAYMPDFGEPLPLPFLYLDWKMSSKLNLNGIVPNDLTLGYKMNQSIDLGVTLKVDGNRYHGDPDKYGVDNPLMKYSEGTFSPMAQIHFSKWLHFNIEGGYAFYRNFEFYDGDDKAQSLDLKQSGYLKCRVLLGI